MYRHGRKKKSAPKKLPLAKRLRQQIFTFPKKRTTRLINTLHLLSGLCALALALTSILLGIAGVYYGAGFWGGALFVVTGILGFGSQYSRDLCTYIPYILFTGLSIALSILVITLASIGMVTDLSLFRHTPDKRNIAMVIHGLTILTGIFETCVGIATFVICYIVWKNYKRNISNASKISNKDNTVKHGLHIHKTSGHANSNKRQTNRPRQYTKVNKKDPNCSMVIAEISGDPFVDPNISLIEPVTPTASRSRTSQNQLCIPEMEIIAGSQHSLQGSQKGSIGNVSTREIARSSSQARLKPSASRQSDLFKML